MFTLRPEAWAKVSQERVREGEEALEQGKRAHRGRGTGSLWLHSRAGAGMAVAGRSWAGHVVEFELDA